MAHVCVGGEQTLCSCVRWGTGYVHTRALSDEETQTGSRGRLWRHLGEGMDQVCLLKASFFFQNCLRTY